MISCGGSEKGVFGEAAKCLVQGTVKEMMVERTVLTGE